MPEIIRDTSITETNTVNLPAKVVVSLRAGFVLALANILCVGILSWAWIRAKAAPKEISVTGSAKKAIQSDLIVWRARIVTSNASLAAGYDELKVAADKTLAFLKKEGVLDGEMIVSSITPKKHFLKDEKGNNSDKVSSFELTQTVEISSRKVKHVADVARRITALIKDGVMLESESPSFLYTKMSDLKIEMLAEATRDARIRAQQIASNSGARLGAVREARMGVMQINAIHTDEVTSYGVNDTSSYDKEITAVVSAKFFLE
jgi:uncharacterized protein